MADGIYKGGIPSQGFTGTFPHSANGGDMFKPNAGPAEQKASKGGPATFDGSSDEGFLNDKGYKAPDEQREGSMKVVDLNEIKHDV